MEHTPQSLTPAEHVARRRVRDHLASIRTKTGRPLYSPAVAEAFATMWVYKRRWPALRYTEEQERAYAGAMSNLLFLEQ